MAIDFYNAGMNAYEQGRFEEAISWFVQGSSDARCDFALAICYTSGKGVEKSFAKATHHYTLAANAGIPPAMTSAGFAYANALGVPQDIPKAVEYLKRAIENNELAAKITLAEIYAKGLSNEGGRKEAAQMLREVLQFGNDEEAIDVYNRYELYSA